MRQAIPPERLEAIYDSLAERYDLQHGLLTAWSDQRGRRVLAERTVREGDRVLDAGAGTGSTALLAARRVGPEGGVTLLDISEGMLAVAHRRARETGLEDRLAFRTGDMASLPFGDGSFDAVLSTYSLCPVQDPARCARELYRVTRRGGRLGIAHSAEPEGALLRRLARAVEAAVWHLQSVAMGCRAIEVRDTFRELGGRVLLDRLVGVPLWPFRVLVLEKPVD